MQALYRGQERNDGHCWALDGPMLRRPSPLHNVGRTFADLIHCLRRLPTASSHSQWVLTSTCKSSKTRSSRMFSDSFSVFGEHQRWDVRLEYSSTASAWKADGEANDWRDTRRHMRRDNGIGAARIGHIRQSYLDTSILEALVGPDIIARGIL